MLPEIAILGDFTLVIDHFISEITDCTQQHKKDTPAARPRSTVLPGFRHAMALSKMDFRIETLSFCLALNNNADHSSIAVVHYFLHGFLQFYLAFFSDHRYFACNPVINKLFYRFS